MQTIHFIQILDASVYYDYLREISYTRIFVKSKFIFRLTHVVRYLCSAYSRV